MWGNEIRTQMPALDPASARSILVDRTLLRLSATLLLAGLLFTFLVGILHTDREKANDHPAAFADYASSDIWTAVHLGQFVGMVIVVAGLLVLFYALNAQTGVAGWAARFGSVAAIVALALYGVLQAVDGVALKQAVDAWVSAPDSEKAARFASAEAIRWLEWGVRSYQSFMLGLSFVLFATVMVSIRPVTRVVGYLMGLTGLAYIAQGWVLGAEGFSATNTAPTLLAYILWLVWSSWLLLSAGRARETT